MYLILQHTAIICYAMRITGDCGNINQSIKLSPKEGVGEKEGLINVNQVSGEYKGILG